MKDPYRVAGYGAEPVGFGTMPAIVVVDFQRAFIDPKFTMGGDPRIERALRQSIGVLDVARQNGVPVANSYVSYGASQHGCQAMPRWKVAPSRTDLVEGTPGAELDPRIVDDQYDFVFSKPGASAFFMTSLALYLTRSGVDTVCVMGCVTSGCVRATIVDAFQYGFRTLMIDDCCGDYDASAHDSTRRDVERRYADVLTSGDVMAKFRE